MLLFLLFIPTLAIGAEIDWSLCAKARCFVQGKCTTPPGADDRLEKNEASIECKSGMQVNFLTEEIALLQIQVDRKMKESDPDLSVYRGDKLVVGCKRIASDSYEVIGEENLKREHNFALFEDRTMFAPDRSICAIQIEKMKKIGKSMKLYTPDDEKLKIRYTPPGTDAEPILITYGFTDLEPFTINSKQDSYQCDPYQSFSERKYLDLFHVMPIRGRDRKILDCTNYNALTYTMRMNGENGVEEISNLECDDSNSHEYTVIKPGPPAPTPEIVKRRDQIFCVAPINRICTNPFPDCATCPSYVPGTDTTEAKLECPNDKWFIDDKYHQLTANDKVICKEHETRKNAAAFYLVTASGDETELSGAVKVSCFTKYDCAIARSDLDYSDCKKGDDCGVLEYANGVMKCEDPVKYTLSVTPLGSNVSLPAQQYTCDVTTGEWKGDGMVPEKDSQVRCSNEDVGPKEAEAGFTQAHMNMAIAGTVILALLTIGIFILLAWCIRRNLNVARIDKKKWMKMKVPDRIKHAKDIFNKVTNVSPDSDVHITNGFEILEMLLETNTEEPEVWEEVYPFLLRVLGSLESIDYKLTDLFLRYLYIKAKTILGDHGWLARTPINKSNPSGLIRCVAINFLALCVFARDDEDVTMLVEDGYRKLGFNAVEQYPHCGELWSLISLLNNNYCDPSDPAKECYLDIDLCMATLYNMSKKPLCGLKTEDIIPQFGSISEQAAKALGRSASSQWHYQMPKHYFKKTASEKNREQVTKYLTGLGQTINYDAGSRIFLQMSKLAHYNKAESKLPGFVPLHEILRKIAPVDVWNAITDGIMTIMIYFNRAHDAKKLQDLIMPDVAQPTEFYTELRASQQEFRSAIEDQLGELWDWFAPSMDVEELKCRPTPVVCAPPNSPSDETVPIPEEELPAARPLLDQASVEAPAAPAPSKDVAAAAPEKAAEPPAADGAAKPSEGQAKP